MNSLKPTAIDRTHLEWLGYQPVCSDPEYAFELAPSSVARCADQRQGELVDTEYQLERRLPPARPAHIGPSLQESFGHHQGEVSIRGDGREESGWEHGHGVGRP